MNNNKILLTGTCGQDGSYLSEFLLANGYEVIGVQRRSSTPNTTNLKNCISHPNFRLVQGDITDAAFVSAIVRETQPSQLYNLAAMSFVKASFDMPGFTFEVNTIGVLNILEAVRQYSSHTKVYHASTSEMFGSSVSYIENNQRYETNDAKSIPDGCDGFQDETTKFTPCSQYGISKVASYHLCDLYRKSYGLFIASGILMNHESPRRGKEFVTRKITDFVGRLANKFDYTDKDAIKPEAKGDNILYLGNLDACRDFGHSRDYIQAMYLMLQQDNPCDYVVSTMKAHSIREVCDKAFSHIGLDYKDYVQIDPKFYRPSEVPFLLGDSTAIRHKLGWFPSVSFDELIEEMVEHDIKEHRNERT